MYMVFVEGRSRPRRVHKELSSAVSEAERLQNIEINHDRHVVVLEIVRALKPKVDRADPVKNGLRWAVGSTNG